MGESVVLGRLVIYIWSKIFYGMASEHTKRTLENDLIFYCDSFLKI